MWCSDNDNCKHGRQTVDVLTIAVKALIHSCVHVESKDSEIRKEASEYRETAEKSQKKSTRMLYGKKIELESRPTLVSLPNKRVLQQIHCGRTLFPIHNTRLAKKVNQIL